MTEDEYNGVEEEEDVIDTDVLNFDSNDGNLLGENIGNGTG